MTKIMESQLSKNIKRMEKKRQIRMFVYFLSLAFIINFTSAQAPHPYEYIITFNFKGDLYFYTSKIVSILVVATILTLLFRLLEKRQKSKSFFMTKRMIIEEFLEKIERKRQADNRQGNDELIAKGEKFN